MKTKIIQIVFILILIIANFIYLIGIDNRSIQRDNEILDKVSTNARQIGEVAEMINTNQGAIITLQKAVIKLQGE